MTIDEAIKHAKEISCKNSKCYQYCANDCSKCEEYHEQLAEWLEELKKLREGRNEIPIATITINNEALQKMVDEKVKEIEFDIQGIRNKFIDDFVKEIKDWQIDIQDNEHDADKYDFVFERIYEIAEELKAGDNNG